MTYRVVAGFVTAETRINSKGARASVDIPRGAELPDDVPEERVQALLALGRIERVEKPARKPSQKRTASSDDES